MATLSRVDSVLMIADLARTPNGFRSFPETLERICERVAALSGADAAALSVAEERRIVIRASWGLSEHYVAYVNEENPTLLDEACRLGLAPAPEAYRSGHMVLVENVKLEPSMDPWQDGARAEGIRSMVSMPIILRGQTVGVLTSYQREPHEHSNEELETLQLMARLAGVAMETACLADGQRRQIKELREAHDELVQQNDRLSGLAAAQSSLAEALVDPDATTIERIARTLAEFTGGSVLVSLFPGHEAAFVGSDEGREAMCQSAIRSGPGMWLSARPVITMGGLTYVRVGISKTPIGSLVLWPALQDEDGPIAQAAVDAAGMMAAEIHRERADRALTMYARPAALLALTRGLYSGIQFKEAAGVLGIPVDARFRLAVFRCPNQESASRLSRRQEIACIEGWPVIATTVDGTDALALLEDQSPDVLRRAGGRLRRSCPEVQSIGISSVLGGIEHLSVAREQALAAAAIDGVHCSATIFDDLGVFGQLARDLSADRVGEYVQRVIGRLLEYDRTRGSCLVDTLACYIRVRGSINAAAAELGIHPNTVNQRMRRAAELAGFDLGSFHDLSRVVLALEWNRILESQPAEAAS